MKLIQVIIDLIMIEVISSMTWINFIIVVMIWDHVKFLFLANFSTHHILPYSSFLSKCKWLAKAHPRGVGSVQGLLEPLKRGVMWSTFNLLAWRQLPDANRCLILHHPLTIISHHHSHGFFYTRDCGYTGVQRGIAWRAGRILGVWDMAYHCWRLHVLSRPL